MRDPITEIMRIADIFASQAADFDQRAASAVEADAAEGSIMRLIDAAATFRLRALSAYQAAAGLSTLPAATRARTYAGAAALKAYRYPKGVPESEAVGAAGEVKRAACLARGSHLFAVGSVGLQAEALKA